MRAVKSSLLGNVILPALRKASKLLIRDFGEICRLQSSCSGANKFIHAACFKAKDTIRDELSKYEDGYKVFFEDEPLKNVDDNGYVWFVNVMDSRTNFANSVALFTMSVALIYKGEAIAAVVDSPILKEAFIAEKGKGAFMEDSRSEYIKMRVGSQKDVGLSLIDCSINNYQVNMVNKLVSQNAIIRSLGSMYLGFCYLGAARYDAVVYSNVNKYRAAVGVLFSNESTGKATYNDGVFIGSNNVLHGKLFSQ